MELYNSLTHDVSSIPADNGRVRIYSCGPTVYERAHIGNLSSFIYADLLARTLRGCGYEVEHVMNITDVDDKTIAGAKKEFPGLEPMAALKKLTEKYEKLFLDDLKSVGVDASKIKFVRATEHIGQMQKLILALLETGVGYEADDGIYFSINAYQARGKKYGQLVDIDVKHSRARVANDEYDKDNPQDFVLWKAQKDGEPAWDFKLPDGRNLAGRPGWHIECSAMSTEYLGQPFEIHTGGVDLKFPHHENEIAQSTALNGDLLAKVFMHSEHMLIDKQKMSKSLNNFLSLEDITSKGFDPLAFRLFVLEGKYSNQRDFSWQNLQHSANRLTHWRQAAAKWQRKVDTEWAQSHQLESGRGEILHHLQNDLNSPEALERIDGDLQDIELQGVQDEAMGKWMQLLDSIDGLLGLKLGERDEKIEKLLKEREAARQANDWSKADEIRDHLKKQGVGINDTPDGPVWFKF